MGKFHKKFCAHAFIKRYMHVPTYMWGMWSENMECRVETHGADSVVGNHSLKLNGYSPLERENQAIIACSFIDSFVEISTDSLTHSQTDTPPIEAASRYAAAA